MRVGFETKNEKYLKLVDEAKELYKEHELIPLKIAKIAIEVCTIRHGGRATFYTLTDFANDTGINRKTLSAWVLTYKIVASKIPNKIKNNEDWAVAMKINASLARTRAILNRQAKTRGGKQLFKEDLIVSPETILKAFETYDDNRQHLIYASDSASRCLHSLRNILSFKEGMPFIYKISEDLDNIQITIDRCKDILLQAVKQ